MSTLTKKKSMREVIPCFCFPLKGELMNQVEYNVEGAGVYIKSEGKQISNVDLC